MKRIVLGSLIALLVLACVHSSAPVATPADAARMSDRYPGLTTSDLSHGRELFLSHCGACHLPPHPTSKSADEWHDRVGEMKHRAHLGDADAELVERYLVTMSTKPAVLTRR